MKFSKVRITDHRPPGAGQPSPLESRSARPGAAARPPLTGLDHWQRLEREMQAEHDKAVRSYSIQTVTAALQDLSARPTGDKRNPEHRWIRHRRAAFQRKLFAPELSKA